MKLLCPIRKEWVAALPEERVRHSLLKLLMEQLGYPKSLIMVEKALKEMPHLKTLATSLPERRADILCFAKQSSSSLFPLLLIECKATVLTHKVKNQLIGYNAHVQARYIALANDKEVQTGWYDAHSGGYTFAPCLPTYQELMQHLNLTHIS